MVRGRNGHGRDDNDDDIEALASKALTPISDFPPGAEYDDDHSISSEEDPNDDDDISILQQKACI